ncbi:MAG: arylamine N-acetyltransferase [Fibrobacteres bacterium]|nr:arylamine N-acetyltransferase [Fibrobacterota bacterium]
MIIFPPEITSLLATLSKIPFENLSKAVSVHMMKEAEESLMMNPEELLAKHQKEGTGGTCFSLTWFLLNNLQRKGYTLYPVLCDRSYGVNTHCCAVLIYNGLKYLLDPGYLAFRPILLDPNSTTTAHTVYNTIIVEPVSSGKYVLSTIYDNETKKRFTIKEQPVTDSEYFKAWQATFLMESLTYPVVTLLSGDAHLYFQKEYLYVRRKNSRERIHIPKSKQPESFEKLFGISSSVTKRALEAFGK